MESHVWDDLTKNIRTMGSKKYFRKGTWQHVIADITGRFNPYCTIVFKRHVVYMSDIRTFRTDLLFVTNSKCQYETCVVKNAKFTLKKGFSFEVLFKSNRVKHKIGVTKSLPISGETRILKKL